MIITQVETEGLILELKKEFKDKFPDLTITTTQQDGSDVIAISIFWERVPTPRYMRIGNTPLKDKPVCYNSCKTFYMKDPKSERVAEEILLFLKEGLVLYLTKLKSKVK